jgi:sugar phosphate isomerase/epimerase
LTGVVDDLPDALGSRVGIMQGRLVPSATGLLDCPPGPRWREEFTVAGQLGLHHVELVAEKVWDPGNPLWTAEGRTELTSVAESTGVALPCLCVNEPLVRPFTAICGDLGRRLRPVLDALPVDVVVVPLLEASDVRDHYVRSTARALRHITDQLHPRTALAVEMSLPAGGCLDFLDQVGSSAVGLCYDVGNATSFGYEPAEELQSLGRAVIHLHAKDRDLAGHNVFFGTGRVAFGPALAALGAIGYKGLITMEATRGVDPVATAAAHLGFLRGLLA